MEIGEDIDASACPDGTDGQGVKGSRASLGPPGPAGRGGSCLYGTAERIELQTWRTDLSRPTIGLLARLAEKPGLDEAQPDVDAMIRVLG